MKKKVIKEFASRLAISFFFAAIFAVIFYFFMEEKISPYVSIINTTAIGNSKITSEASYNFDAKKLIKYPSYGSKYGTLIIPSINLKLPVYHGDNKKILRKGVGHYTGSYFPGENGSILYAAHNTSGFFQKLDKIKIGDMITIETNYGTFKYQVTNTKIAKENDKEAFPITHEKEMLMLYTCWPINRSIVGRKTQRYIVYADRIGGNNEES